MSTSVDVRDRCWVRVTQAWAPITQRWARVSRPRPRAGQVSLLIRSSRGGVRSESGNGARR